MSTAVHAPCQQAAEAVHHDGPRTAADIRLVVLHVAEAPTAAGVAAYFATPKSGGSTQLVVDDSECYRCLPNLVIPWGAPGGNLQGLHLEIAGYAAWTTEQWMAHPQRLDRAAYHAAKWCHHYGLPPRYITASGLRAGRRGVTTHHAVNRWQAAIGAPGDHSHTCPFPPGTTRGHFPIDHVMVRVRYYHAAID